jgi:hypothetical protein
VKDTTEDYLNAVNATDKARTETNKALANLERAANANTNVNVTADDINKQLDGLDK